MDQRLRGLVDVAAGFGATDPVAVARTGPCQVWRMGGERTLWLKAFASSRSFEQERSALRSWGLGGVPTVVGEGDRALLLSHVGGAHEHPIEAWAAAGAFVGAMHSRGPEDTDSMSVADAIARRRDAWCKQVAPWVDAAVLSAARAAVEPGAFEGAVRVRCHRDFQPRNWLWHATDGLGVIDFEHARWDHPLVDLVRVLDHVAPGDARYEAFIEAWSPGEIDPLQLRSLRVLHGLASLAWGAREGDAAFEALGRSILASP